MNLPQQNTLEFKKVNNLILTEIVWTNIEQYF